MKAVSCLSLERIAEIVSIISSNRISMTTSASAAETGRRG
jgi:hypothetical protein